MEEQQQTQQDNGNPIYKFLKDNGLTDKDEASFNTEYSDQAKAKTLYGFFKDNSLTDKDEATFYDSYFKKKDHPEVSWATGFQNIGDQYSKGSGEPLANPTPATTEPKLTPYTPEPLTQEPIAIGNNNHPAGLNAAFETQIAKPVTDQERQDVRHNEIERNRASGLVDNSVNFLSRLAMGTEKAGVDAISGVGTMARDLLFTKDAQNKMYLPDGTPNPEANDDMATILRGLDGYSKDVGDLLADRQLSKGMIGQGFQTVSDIAPDILAAAAVPEIPIGQGVGMVGGYALKALANPFTRTLIAKKAIEGYRQANLKGEDVGDKVIGAAEGGLHGAKEGTEMYLLGELTGSLGGQAVKAVEGKVANKVVDKTLKVVADQATQYAIWGLYGAGQAALSGSEHPFEEGNASGFVGLLLHNKGLLEKGSATKEENSKIVQDFLDINDRIKTESLFRATPESISEVIKMPGTAEEFHTKGMDYTEQALKESDPDKKSQLIEASSAFKKIADIKQSVDAISTDRKSWDEMIERSDLDPDVATAMKTKVDEIHKTYNPDEIQKTELAGKITKNRNKVKAKKEVATEDPVQAAKDEVELESTHEEINKDTEDLKTIIRNENSPISGILPGEKFRTLDGTEHTSSGRDVKSGIIMNSKGQSFPYDQIDVTKLIKPTEEATASPISEQEAKPVSVIEPVVAEPVVPKKVKNVKEAAKPVEEAKTEVEPTAPTEDPLVVTEEALREQDYKTLSHRDIDKITRSPSSPDPDLSTKQSYQAVLKQEFGKLSKSSPEDVQEAVRKFVGRVHEYRSKNRIKSEKFYKEKGAKEDFNGLNYWIDSAEALLSQKLGKNMSSSTQEVTRMRSDWAKSKMPEGFKTDSESIKETKPTVVVEPEVTTPEPAIKKSVKPRVKKATVIEEALDIIPEADIPVTPERKDQSETADDVIEPGEGLSQVGFDGKDKPVFVLKDNVSDYEKYTKAIEKKLDRIANSDYVEGSDERTERAIIDTLKSKLKDMEVKPIAFKAQTTQAAEEASLLDRAETALNKLAESGRNDLKSGRKDLGSFMSPDVMAGASKVIAAEIGRGAIKSVRGLEKLVGKLINDGKLNASELSSMSDIDKANLLKLVKSEHERLSSGKSAGELMQESHEKNAAEIKALQNKDGLFSKSSIEKLRSNLWDYNGNLVKSLNKDGSFKPVGSTDITESTGQRAERLLKTMPAAYSKASLKYSEAMDRVYGSGIFGEGNVKSLSKNEQKLLSDIVMYQRVIELDGIRLAAGEKLMAHPGKLDMVQAKQKLSELQANDPSIVKKYGKYDYADLEGRANEYHKVLQDLIDYRFANGLISKGSYDALKDVKYYSPRIFLKHLVDNDGTYKSNSRVIEKTIKSIKGGDTSEVVSNLAKIMADSINVVYETAARNNSNKAIADVIENNPTQDWGETAVYSAKFIKRLKENQLANDTSSAPSITGSDEVRVLDGASKYKYIEPEFAAGPKGYSLRTYRDGGIKRGFYIKDQYAKELDGLRLDSNKWVHHLSGASTVIPLATGANWAFAVTNPFRDAGFAVFTTNNYSKFLPLAYGQYAKDFLGSLKDSLLQTGDYTRYATQGGGGNSMFKSPHLASGHEAGWERDIRHAVDLIVHRLPSALESAGRLAVRKRAIINMEGQAKKDGVTVTPEIRQNIEEQATYAALKVLNFSDGGKIPKAVNQAVPFFNVGIIATRNLTRYARANPMAFAGKVAQLSAYVVASSAWNNGLVGKNDEMGKYYRQNISESDKANNFIVMTPIRYKDSDGNLQYLIIKIPKSQDQMLFAGAAEYGSMMALGVDGYTPEKWVKHRALKDLRGLISVLPESGSLLPPIIKGWVGYLADYDLFREKHFTTSSEMAKRKNEDQYDPLKTPERWKTIGKSTGLSPIRLQGAFKATVPTNNQWFRGADALYTAAFGEDTKAIALQNQQEGTFMDKFEKQLESLGANEQAKQDVYEFLVKDVLTKTLGTDRIFSLTSPMIIDEDRDDKAAEDASDTFHDTEAMKVSAYEFKKGAITRDDLIERAKTISKDPLIIKKAIGQAKAAIRLKRGTPEAFDIVFSGIASPEGQAKLLHEKVNSMSKPDGLKLIQEIRSTGLFTGSFWVQYNRLDRGK